MDLTSITEPTTILGLSAVAMSAIVYTVLQLNKSNQREIDQARSERIETHKALMSYVEQNNHQKTEMIEQSTETMVSIKNSIDSHTKSIEAMTNVLLTHLSKDK